MNGSINAVAATLFGTGPGVSGFGQLAAVNFLTLVGDSTTTVDFSNVILLDSGLHEIPSTSVPAVVRVVPEPLSGMLLILGLLPLALTSRRRRPVFEVALSLASLVAPVRAAARSYKFAIAAKNGDTIAGKTLTGLSSFGINDEGTIVFGGDFAGGSGIFTPSQLLAATGDSISGRTLAAVGGPVINNAGTVVFSANIAGGGQGIFTPDRLLAATGDVIGGVTLRLLLGAQINNAGTVLFGSFGDGTSLFRPAHLFTLSQLLLSDGDKIGDTQISINGGASINDAGTVVLQASFVDSAGVPRNGIFTLSQLLWASGQRIGGMVVPDIGGASPVINNSGAVVWNLGPNPGSIIVSPTEVLVRSTDTIGGTTLLALSGNPAMNDAGTLAFTAFFPCLDPTVCGPFAATGVFTTTGLVASPGDVADGKIMTAFNGQVVINNAGVFAFMAGFADGGFGIVTATPISSGIEGDVNGDGVVDCTDLSIVRSALGRKFGQAGFDPRADLNGDGLVDILDLTFLAQKLQSPCQ